MSLLASAVARTVSPLPEHLAAGVYLGGYGSYRQRRAEGVHDDLFCRALALSDGGTTLLLLVLDLVGARPRWLLELRRAIARTAGLPVEHVLVACTHSHASPDTQGLWGGVPNAYYRYLHQRCVEAATSALAELSEARLEVATAFAAGLARNRRGWDHTDTSLTVLRALRPDGSPVAALVNFACHPTVTPASNVLVSCDFPSGLRQALEEELGGVAIYINGAQGDATPAAAGEFAEAEELGRRLAGIAIDALASAVPVEPPIALRERRVEIRFRTGLLPRSARWLLAVALPAVRLAARRGALRPLCDRLATGGRGQTAQVLAALAMAAEGSLVASGLEIRTRTCAGYLRIGEALQGLAAPGEVLTRLALPLKSSLPGPHRLFLGLTNDTLGYFVPEDEWMTGRNHNYEEYVSSGRQAAPALEAALQALMEER
jgi:hypothetical protein